MRTYWIPGWQYDAAAFQPLFDELEIEPADVLAYNDTVEPREQWLQAQAQLLNEECTLVGWSLGAMLACELAERSANVTQVLVLNANTRFAGGAGLDENVAASFMQRYQRNPAVTRKRFAALVDAHSPERVADLLLDGNHISSLQWLYDIDVQSVDLSCSLSVLLAEQDRLVPKRSAHQAWAKLTSDITTLPGQHSLPFSEPVQVANWLRQRGVGHG